MGKYLKLFSNHAEYDAFLETEDFIKPNVSHCIQENDVHYNPIPHDYSKDYLTFVALEDGATFTFNGATVNNITNKASYSLDDGNTWTEIESGVSTSSINTGDKILWKGEMTPNTGWSLGIGNFTSTKTFDVEGNIMSLLYGDNFKEETDLTDKNGAFYRIFYNDTNITNADKLSLPATTLSTSCYERIFEGCTGLTTAPELPATTLANRCYARLFYNCSSLTTAPELPATTLAEECYSQMFYGCTNLTTAPELPVTNLVNGCYNYMFHGCTSLTTAPELPATTLAEECYRDMFSGCTSLTTAPELPATTLVGKNCYYHMFYGCTSLTTAPELPATTLADWCYNAMFYGCTSIPAAPELPATTLTEACYTSMFSGCTSLVDVPTVLPATTMTSDCYSSMFKGCTSLTTAPELPATTLADYCYDYMFKGCTSLTTAPELPATTLVGTSCYRQMFNGCTRLNYIKAMFTTTPSTAYTSSWVNNVSATGTFVKNSAATWDVSGVHGIPSGWTVQTASE